MTLKPHANKDDYNMTKACVCYEVGDTLANIHWRLQTLNIRGRDAFFVRQNAEPLKDVRIFGAVDVILVHALESSETTLSQGSTGPGLQ